MTIRLLPFDVDAASTGARIVTRDGREAHLLEYRPRSHESVRVIVQIKGARTPTHYFVNGYRVLEKETKYDLFLAA
ncbi:hypothetical protein BcepSauron_144 [Burkholderia phage BcepSauron]|uniref:Uncharacterized protein n=2 Tax=Sarumanvirus TaxID=2843450 RepID=A0A482ML74_9CAUD|nr:hypothetical protein H1O16_gp144 [Burkholderia phage BcepSaruman]YP_009904522.1 hypothetical protein H1O17_gp144 [Burkholderia phage BcepSauron]QBQ74524.1 hypothetical protein BcepSauron_144 [Burkholderia phage BcepSauron]QBX06557.1 hypothetical protein BcepSaruman_144 [Burkholderia phage BcepSaruman]